MLHLQPTFNVTLFVMPIYHLPIIFSCTFLSYSVKCSQLQSGWCANILSLCVVTNTLHKRKSLQINVYQSVYGQQIIVQRRERTHTYHYILPCFGYCIANKYAVYMIGVMPAMLSALGFRKIFYTLFRVQKRRICAVFSQHGLRVNAIRII